MTHPFKPYEIRVLETLLKPAFTTEMLSEILGAASTPRAEYTGYGFYVSVQHPGFGRSRRVFNGTPALHGCVGSHDAGFVAFLEGGQLTLEIFPWDGEKLPETFRDGDVHLTHD